jgi:hypothetical protein
MFRVGRFLQALLSWWRLRVLQTHERGSDDRQLRSRERTPSRGNNDLHIDILERKQSNDIIGALLHSLKLPVGRGLLCCQYLRCTQQAFP